MESKKDEDVFLMNVLIKFLIVRRTVVCFVKKSIKQQLRKISAEMMSGYFAYEEEDFLMVCDEA